jgi:hypothetical protein
MYCARGRLALNLLRQLAHLCAETVNVSIRQQTSAHVTMRQHRSKEDLCAEEVTLARVREHT